MQTSIGSVDIDDYIGYLQEIKKSGYKPIIAGDLWFPNGAWDNEICKQAFRRLSTCKESCGCTGYRPKQDCPDKTCYCNTDV